MTGPLTGSWLAIEVLGRRPAPSAPLPPGHRRGDQPVRLAFRPTTGSARLRPASAAPNSERGCFGRPSARQLTLPLHTGPPPLTPTAVTAAALPALALASLPERPKMEAGVSGGDPLPRLRRPLQRGAEPRDPLLPQPPFGGGGTVGGWCWGRGPRTRRPRRRGSGARLCEAGGVTEMPGRGAVTSSACRTAALAAGAGKGDGPSGLQEWGGSSGKWARCPAGGVLLARSQHIFPRVPARNSELDGKRETGVV